MARLIVNGTDLTDLWRPEMIDSSYYLPLAPWATALGLTVYKSDRLNAVMVCSRDQCTPLSLAPERNEGKEKEGAFYWSVDAIGSVLGATVWVTRDRVELNLPDVPLPGPIRRGERVPDVTWYGKGGAPFIPAELCRGRTVLLKGRENDGHPFLWHVLPTRDWDRLPQRWLADPFDTFAELFNGHGIVGLDPEGRWVEVFEELSEAVRWAQEGPGESGRPQWQAPLTVLTVAWVKVLLSGGTGHAWLSFAEIQRTYCGLEQAVLSYESAARSGGSVSRVGLRRWGVGLWLLGKGNEAREVLSGLREEDKDETVRELLKMTER